LSRAGFDLYRNLVNTPAFFALLPPVGGLACLDLGCGERHITRLLAGRGARAAALDVVESFITAAVGVGRRGISYTVEHAAQVTIARPSSLAAGPRSVIESRGGGLGGEPG
jgi:hypothetical protein